VTLTFDTLFVGSFAVFYPLNLLRLGIQQLTGSRHARALEIRGARGCQCISRHEDPWSERYLDCWEPDLGPSPAS
jgi:hypothetical protein